MKIAYTLFLTIIYAAVVFTGSSFAQNRNEAPKKTLVQKAFEVFPSSLDSEIEGIVESTIYNVILLKKYYPAENYSEFINKLNELAEESQVPSIRYKAHLASLYLNFSDRIQIEPKNHVFEREYLFRQISDQLESNLVVSN